MTHLADPAPAGPHPAVRLAVLGAGAWGTVLAALLARNGARTALWARRADQADAIERERRNRDYLPQLDLPDGVRGVADLDLAVAGAAGIFLAVPSGGLRATLARLRPPAGATLVSCAKGIETDGFTRFSQAIAAHHPAAPLAVLSGPNLASEIAAGLPAAATVAATDAAVATRVQSWLQQPDFRVYTSGDVIGVEVAGALKNVIALAAGMCDGLRLGDNAKAAILTRGLAETVRLGRLLGGEPRTFYGLAGVGDLIATCASQRSRNHTAGERLARGATLAELRASRLTAEGIPTVEAVVAYADAHGIEMPIAREVHAVVFGGKSPQRAVADLMEREGKPE